MLNLLVYRDIPPEAIFLSTFTEKAALQLKEGLRTLLALVTKVDPIVWTKNGPSLATLCQAS